jgi:hypothetical protein
MVLRVCDCRGANMPNQQCGSTALILAAFHNNTDCVRLLVKAGADKNARNTVRSMKLLNFVVCF